MENNFQFLIYRSAEENVSVDAIVKEESIWLSQKGMAELFECSTDNISLHLKNIFSSGELDKNSVTEKISATAADGKNYSTQFYNLDAIISVGYRVNSRRATHFRIWATGILKEYMTKGFVLDDCESIFLRIILSMSESSTMRILMLDIHKLYHGYWFLQDNLL